MILGPDGKPIMAAQIVGAPALVDFQPLTKEMLPSVVAPLEQALASGVPPQTPTEVPLATLCVVVSSLLHFMERAEAAEAALAEASGEE